MSKSEKNSRFQIYLPSIITVLFGIVMIINPGFIELALEILGVLLFITAVVFIIKFIMGGRNGNIPKYSDLVVFFIALALGVFCELLPFSLHFLIPIFLGLWLIGDGFLRVGGILASRDTHPHPIFDLILSICVIVLGVLIIVNYNYFTQYVQWFIGASFVFMGIMSCIDTFTRLKAVDEVKDMFF